MKQFYVTTAIAYPNGEPHLGHALEFTIADCYHRWYKSEGCSTYFLTGTDENGQKLVESANIANLPTNEFVDLNAKKFIGLAAQLNLSHNDFIRTTEKRHAHTCIALWKKLQESGNIYFGTYKGQYCLACESFYTETQADAGKCPTHQTALSIKEEAGYFLKMSAYQDFIIQHLKSHPEFITPQSSYTEMMSRLTHEELRDLPISRPNDGWGIPVPGDEKFVMYTWFDALINYYTAIDTPELHSFWPCDLHIIGKDIVWFHAVIWPIILHAAKLPLPRQIYVHGMILAEDGKKMSKSLGNVVSPQDLFSKYHLDSIRYYLLRAIPAQSDGRFSEKELIEKHNAELGNSFGNLIMRVIKLYLKNHGPEVSSTDVTREIDFCEFYERMKKHMNEREHNKALEVLWEGVNSMNQYVNTQEPWKIKDDEVKLKSVVFNCLHAIHAISCLLQAFLPETAAKALLPLGVSLTNFSNIHFNQTTFHLSVPEPLFPKIDTK